MPLVFLACGMAQAQVRYTIAPSNDGKSLDVEMSFTAKGKKTELQMPSWSPGLYVKEDYWKTLAQVVARDSRGKSLTVTHVPGDSWSIRTKRGQRITVTYERPIDRTNQRLGMFSSDSDAVHYRGPTVYLYVVRRKAEPCVVTFNLPKGQRVATSLQPVRAGYLAGNYDELADCPVTFGRFREATYRVNGVPYTMAFRGEGRDKMDTARAVKVAKFISKTETRFFAGTPFQRYVWHVMARSNMRDGAGGVEHASSTQIFMTTDIGPGSMSGMAHEFFHLWNVKRIRPKNLGPFDYTKLPRVGDLWWLEGVTNYYAAMLPYRAGYGKPEDILRRMGEEISGVRSNPARFQVSPWDSGFKTPEAQNMRSSGYKVSYYPTGWELGLLFDIELRSRTHGRRSLDNVERALWAECEGGKPFPDGEIRRLLVRFGGRQMGGLYDDWVMKPGELPAERVLHEAGLKLEPKGKNWEVAADKTSNPPETYIRTGLLAQKHYWQN